MNWFKKKETKVSENVEQQKQALKDKFVKQLGLKVGQTLKVETNKLSTGYASVDVKILKIDVSIDHEDRYPVAFVVEVQAPNRVWQIKGSTHISTLDSTNLVRDQFRAALSLLAYNIVAHERNIAEANRFFQENVSD